MAPHSSTVAWKIPWMEEPGRLQSMGSLRIRHNWETSLSLSTFMHWRRKWQPTPVFLPGESQGRGSLVGCSPWVAQSRTWLKQLSSSKGKKFLFRFIIYIFRILKVIFHLSCCVLAKSLLYYEVCICYYQIAFYKTEHI